MINASLNEVETGWMCGTGKQERLVGCRLVLDKYTLLCWHTSNSVSGGPRIAKCHSNMLSCNVA